MQKLLATHPWIVAMLLFVVGILATDASVLVADGIQSIQRNAFQPICSAAKPSYHTDICFWLVREMHQSNNNNNKQREKNTNTNQHSTLEHIHEMMRCHKTSIVLNFYVETTPHTVLCCLFVAVVDPFILLFIRNNLAYNDAA